MLFLPEMAIKRGVCESDQTTHWPIKIIKRGFESQVRHWREELVKELRKDRGT